MEPNGVVVLLRVLLGLAARAYRRAGAEAEARALERVPVNPGNGYACITRALYTAEAALRAREGLSAGTIRAGSAPATALEITALVRVAIAGLLSSPAPEGEKGWYEMLVERAGFVFERAA